MNNETIAAPEQTSKSTDGKSALNAGLGTALMGHLNCSYILPGLNYPTGKAQWMRERTHGCWCSSWKLLDDGTYKIWRDNAWQAPKKGELRKVSNAGLG